ncbi:hypothetical protein QR680_011741 [Steinernema hermaphroditum]|uniref:Nucleoporin NSP1-like C-terminal domain-containing protein n=1 Tax=Steinernema hermaphroditum TaxID=289476 RepID=A0AA39LZI2_9BILA|nr:hypothetical protein QR680_011741 [Steinernema hermaphroditum]
MFGKSKFPSTPVSQPNQSEAGKSLFGAQSTTGGSLFGGNAATTLAQSTTPVMFGQSTFPSTPASQPNQLNASKSLFGAKNTAGGNLFGGNTANTPAQATFSFTGAATSTAAAAPSGLFGSGPSAIPTFSVTPATPTEPTPPGKNFFGGNGTGGGNLFGGNAATTLAQSTTPVMFGQSNFPSTSVSQPNQSETAKSLFGAQITGGGSLFGGNAATTLAQSTFSFAGAATSTTSAPPSGLFGSAPSTALTFSVAPATPVQSKPQATTSGHFGGKGTGGSNLFGGNTANTSAQSTISFPGAATSTTAAPPSGLFGSAPSTALTFSVAPATPVQSKPQATTSGHFGAQITGGGSLFGGNAATTPAQSTFSFAGAATSTTAAPPSGLFGSAPSTAPTFSLAPATPVQSKPQATTSGHFGGKGTGGSNLFGGNTANTSAQSTISFPGAATSTTAAPPSGLFGSAPSTAPTFSLAPTTPALSKSQETTSGHFGGKGTGGSNLFGGNTANTSAQSTISFPGAATSTTAAPPSGLFGVAQSTAPTFSLAPATPVQSKSQETTSELFGGKSTGGSNFFGGNTASTAAQLTNPISSLQPAAATQPNQPETAKMTMKELEQMLQMMVCEYEEQERIFIEKVVELNAYDAVLRDSRQKVFELVEEVNGIEKEKDRIKANVEFLETKEKEMDEIVVELEKAVGVSDWTDGSQVKLNSSLMPPTQADNQRQSMMQMQVGLDAQIKQADDDLADILEQIAELQALAPASTGEDQEERNAALDQVRSILDFQITALQNIDDMQGDVTRKIATIVDRLESEGRHF